MLGGSPVGLRQGIHAHLATNLAHPDALT